MKIALCLSGLSNDHVEHYYNVTKSGILDKFNPDTYLAVWSNDYSGCWQSTHERAAELYRPVSHYTEFQHVITRGPTPHTELTRDFMEAYPRKDRWLNFTKGYPFPKKIKTSYGRQNVLNMFYMIWKCNELKREYEQAKGFTYDVVIRARIDRGWEINSTLKQRKNTIFLHSIKDDNALSDWFSYGSSRDIDKYSNVFPNMLKLAEQQEDYSIHPHTHEGKWYHFLDPHRTLRLHLENKKLSWEILPREEIRGHGISHKVGIA